MCPCIHTFELDSANTGVTSHLIGSFAVIFSYVGGFQIKDMKTCIKIFRSDFKFLAASNLLAVFDPYHFKWGVPEISHWKITSDPLRAPTGEGFWVKTGGATRKKKINDENICLLTRKKPFKSLESLSAWCDHMRVY